MNQSPSKRGDQPYGTNGRNENIKNMGGVGSTKSGGHAQSSGGLGGMIMPKS